MPLPKIATPTYEMVLPSSNKKIKYRPFLVKEEKILIIAMESEDQKQITNALKTVINNCILSRGIKVDKLSTFDIEYLFLNIRGKSVGENVEVMITCPDDNETQVPVIIPLDEIKIQRNPKHRRDIKLDDNLVMRMRYPSLNEFIKTNFDFSDEVGVEESFDLVISCIDQIFNEEESWTSSDCTKKEMVDFLEQLSSKQFKDVEQFFDTMPKLSHKIKVTNPKTKVENEIVLEGLSSFFE
tara:strand:- start:3389 stop:4108 length:720 start_codon:yes stop_codon:yes gene_type:complete